ncbi:polysaccharide deacetylase family protein [Paenirhodobacter populi]|uniref:Chitooligosaccharide deacetylase n=1 Tax=Paenirhodobacter populi TaxID=2306993 RepID=A0A443IRB7_9RHOB|nr:polysaccharide deacetylase family protein [Sinirhodobacter populi]RWR09220.1 hypothetical protein D2T33_14610 [Sinirhodobacter populi]
MAKVVRVCFAFDVDGRSLTEAKRRQGITMSPEMVKTLAEDQSIMFDRVLDFFASTGLRQTFFVTGKVAEDEPERMASALAAGHEIAFHGYSHMPLCHLSDAAEADEFDRTSDYFREKFGVRLLGMRAPSYSFGPRTPGNMRRSGMIYDSSAIDSVHPRFVPAGEAGYWEIPVRPEVDDWLHCVRLPELGYHAPIKSPDEVLAIYCDSFDRCYREAGCFVTVWHPFVTMSDRYRSVAPDLLHHIRQFDGVVFCTMQEIAAACEADLIPACSAGAAGRM